ncbi:MAG: YceI family protein [Desulfobacterales bacterium]|nr:MAG: YceI family protein [Desulfobacterales bacterium]
MLKGVYCRPKISGLILLMAWVGLLMPPLGRAVSEAEQLIVFVQPGVSPVDEVFQARHLPEIRRLAEAMGVAVHVVDAAQRSPAEIAVTPLIVYQNHRGRSIYQGRTTTPQRIQNFIRTSRYVPQGQARLRREQIPVWENGRARIWAPLKVAAVTGTPPEGYDHAAFVTEALQSISEGFQHFRFQKIAELGRADRGFYMDFYPWLSPDGTLYLSLALYSQFHCKQPVFEKKKEPLVGPWQERGKLFRTAAALLEEAVTKQISDPDGGDGFDPVSSGIPRASWEQIGFALPFAPQIETAESPAPAAIPQNWILEKSGPTDPLMIQFRFPAPLDHYAGEVAAGRGEFFLPESLQIDGAQGYVEIDTQTAVTMGEPVLDEAIRGSVMLNSKKYPTAKFLVESMTGDGQPIAYGRLTPANIRGIFTLKGKSVPLSSVAEFEPVIGEGGRPRLLVRSAFQIDLRTFDVEGADGPAPARYTLLLDVNFVLKAKD